MTEPPNHAYYRPKHGRWEGEYRFTVLSVRALFAGSMGLADKLSFATMGLFCRVFGAFRIETRVDASFLDTHRVFHTTRLSKWGLVLQTSEEWFDLAEDGRSVVVTGAMRTLPLRFIERPYRDSHASIDDTGGYASYEFVWGGARLLQRSYPEGEALRFEQDVDGCRGAFVLRRRA